MDPRHIHDTEQGKAGMAEMAEMMGYYRQRLLDAGFTVESAEEMVIDLHDSQLEMSRHNGALGAEDA